MPLYEELIRRTLAARETAEAVRDDSRRVRGLAQLLRDAQSGEALLTRCAWCEKLKLGEEWLRLEAVGSGSMTIMESLIRKASHGICPDCFRRVDQAAAAERAAGARHGDSGPSRNGVTEGNPRIASSGVPKLSPGPASGNDPLTGV
jgi:hypothetical protein